MVGICAVCFWYKILNGKFHMSRKWIVRIFLHSLSKACVCGHHQGSSVRISEKILGSQQSWEQLWLMHSWVDNHENRINYMVLGNCRSNVCISQCTQVPKNFNCVTTMWMPFFFSMRDMQLARNDAFDNTEHEEMLPALEEIVVQGS